MYHMMYRHHQNMLESKIRFYIMKDEMCIHACPYKERLE